MPSCSAGMIGLFQHHENPNQYAAPEGLSVPCENIAYPVWAYPRLAMSTADVEDLLAERGVIVSREAIRLWVNRFGPHFANCVRRDRPRPNDKWHLDEVVISIRGKKYWLWRAIDAEGEVLDILVPDADHRAHKGLNNAIEGSHRPTCKREKIIGRFKAGSEISVRSRSDQPDLPSSPTHIATPELTRSASRQNTQSRWRRNLPTSNTLRHAANNLAMPAQGRDHNLPNRRPCGNPCLGTFPPIFVQYFGSRGCVH